MVFHTFSDKLYIQLNVRIMRIWQILMDISHKRFDICAIFITFAINKILFVVKYENQL